MTPQKHHSRSLRQITTTTTTNITIDNSNKNNNNNNNNNTGLLAVIFIRVCIWEIVTVFE
jgi:hypothetical protein